MTLVPMSAPLEAEIEVASRDVGFIRPGDPVTMKIDAFNFAEHGTVEGKVKWISEDAFTTDDNGVPIPAYYRVRVNDHRDQADRCAASTFRLIPGMTLIGRREGRHASARRLSHRWHGSRRRRSDA